MYAYTLGYRCCYRRIFQWKYIPCEVSTVIWGTVPLILQKYRSYLKIQVAQKGDMKQAFYIEDRQTLGATVQG